MEEKWLGTDIQLQDCEMGTDKFPPYGAIQASRDYQVSIMLVLYMKLRWEIAIELGNTGFELTPQESYHTQNLMSVDGQRVVNWQKAQRLMTD